MEFCVISPTSGLERYATRSKTHLVLAHLFDGAYADFYLKQKNEGDVIILDNGTYENGQPHFTFDIVRRLKPQVVVLPDFLLHPWKKTWHAAISFLDK